jgi:5-methylcytosine-specific restriction enzyme B
MSVQEEIVFDITEKLEKVKRLLGSGTASVKSSGIIGENLLYYGVPGCGKSYIVNKKYLKNIDNFFYERITFHPEYTYEDFVGQVMPIVNEENRIEYQFVPGPFTRIVAKSIIQSDKMFYLVIEELNRGNAPAIFGDIFQLLDRVKDNKYLASGDIVGKSEYLINNVNIESSINKMIQKSGKTVDIIKGLYIPNNLTIIATMNTSDQNVFTLDTAFKRRFDFIKIKNNISECYFKDYLIPTKGNTTTWQIFNSSINDKLIPSLNASITNSEDKKIGLYFIDSKDLINPELESSDEEKSRKSRAFAEKVIMYLWNDVFKYDRDEIFEKTSLDEVVEDFIEIGVEIFKNPQVIFQNIKNEGE